MKRALMMLVPALLGLSACAPFLGVVQGEKATLSRAGAAVTFTNPGPDTAQAVTLFLRGDGLEVRDPRCTRRDGRSWGCKLGDVPKGRAETVGTVGVVGVVSATFYRAGAGARPIYLRAGD